MISYLSIGFLIWLSIYLYQRRFEGMNGVLDSLPMFLVYNLLFWPLGVIFVSAVLIAFFFSLGDDFDE